MTRTVRPWACPVCFHVRASRREANGHESTTAAPASTAARTDVEGSCRPSPADSSASACIDKLLGTSWRTSCAPARQPSSAPVGSSRPALRTSNPAARRARWRSWKASRGWPCGSSGLFDLCARFLGQCRWTGGRGAGRGRGAGDPDDSHLLATRRPTGSRFRLPSEPVSVRRPIRLGAVLTTAGQRPAKLPIPAGTCGSARGRSRAGRAAGRRQRRGIAPGLWAALFQRSIRRRVRRSSGRAAGHRPGPGEVLVELAPAPSPRRGGGPGCGSEFVVRLPVRADRSADRGRLAFAAVGKLAGWTPSRPRR